jgi:3-oxoadipate enol-lactonase
MDDQGSDDGHVRGLVCHMTLSHEMAGVGPAVLLLHSTACDRRMWDPQWRPLIDAGYRVIRFDFRGYGETPLGCEPYDDAQDVAELLAELGVDRAAYVGSSYGGKVALELAARRPTTVTALALLCAARPGHVSSETLREFGRRENELLEHGDVDGAVELNLVTWLGPEADEGTRQQVRMMQRHSFDIQLGSDDFADNVVTEIDLGKITAPCLAVSGRYDLVDFREIAADLPSIVATARHVELDWAGHLPSLERPAEVSAMLFDFLGEFAVDGGSTGGNR